jgi:hypothetical protein
MIKMGHTRPTRNQKVNLKLWIKVLRERPLAKHKKTSKMPKTKNKRLQHPSKLSRK